MNLEHTHSSFSSAACIGRFACHRNSFCHGKPLCCPNRPLHKYDFSRDYLGPSGIVPLMEALRCDGSYTSLDLSRTGVTDSGCAVLFDCLKVWGEGVRAGR